MSLSVSLRHRLGDFALDLAFEAPDGVTVLFGRSGSGKTSVINAVAGLMQPDAGRIAVAGRVLFDSAAGVSVPVHRRRLGYVFQEGGIAPGNSALHTQPETIKEAIDLSLNFWFVLPSIAPQARATSAHKDQ